MIVRPHMAPGESSVWYANFWKFVSVYLNHHYAKNYCLSAENSIDIHTKSPTIPEQIIVIVSRGGGVPITLPFRTSMFPYKDPRNLPEERVEIDGLQIMELGYALCKATPTFFGKYPQQAEIALRLIRSPDQLLIPIFKHAFQASAARLIGAYQFLNDHAMADGLISGLQNFGVNIKPEIPFVHSAPLTISRAISPHAARISSMWSTYRELILKVLPNPSKQHMSSKECLSAIDEIYKQDAYNSLSIEGYDVDQQLIDKVRNNHWNPDLYADDSETRNGLAARGYYEAFKEVKKSLLKMLDGADPVETLERDLSKWYQNLFAPSVRAGILKPTDVLGYRKSPVYIRNSRHIPLSKDALLDAMEAFFFCLKSEAHPAVRAILGHFIFVYIHPYMDGNGRIGRFLMNSMLVSGGYPWTIVKLVNRSEYLSTLEIASVDHDIVPFATFILKEMLSSTSSSRN